MLMLKYNIVNLAISNKKQLIRLFHVKYLETLNISMISQEFKNISDK